MHGNQLQQHLPHSAAEIYLFATDSPPRLHLSRSPNFESCGRSLFCLLVGIPTSLSLTAPLAVFLCANSVDFLWCITPFSFRSGRLQTELLAADLHNDVFLARKKRDEAKSDGDQRDHCDGSEGDMRPSNCIHGSKFHTARLPDMARLSVRSAATVQSSKFNQCGRLGARCETLYRVTCSAKQIHD